MKLPPKKKPGDPVLAADWNVMVDALAARTPRGGANNDVLVTSGGFTMRTRQTAGSQAGGHPFRLSATVADGNPAIAIAPGTVDGMMAVIGPVALDDDTRPSLVAVDGNNIVYLEITWTPASATDPDGKSYLVSGGSAEMVEVKQVAEADWPPAETMPQVDEAGGKTNGKFIQRIGKYTAETKEEKLVVTSVANDTLRHSLNATFCAPEQFSLTIL